jgi:RimJ/RimL family protein N-acetyltransferase
VQATILADAGALLAYELGSAYRGAGYATDACQRVMRELVEGYGVREIRAQVDTRNERSIRLLERLGFERTALFPQADFFKGMSSDEYVYSWIPLKPTR